MKAPSPFSLFFPPRKKQSAAKHRLLVAVFLLLVGGLVSAVLPYALRFWEAQANPYASIPRVRPTKDTNKNGINDTDNLILGARAEARRAPVYRSAYYKGGYPPDNEGVCTDLVWRAFRDAGYDLKAMIDDDIRANPSRYPRVQKKPDANIDFRRVPNMTAFFSQYAKRLTTDIMPGNVENLRLWQGGDLVVFTNPDHIAILSDKRNTAGVPLLIHNQGPVASEGDDFMAWYERGIVAHFRFPK